MDTTEDSARNSPVPGTSASLRRQNASTPWQRIDANKPSVVAPTQTSDWPDLAGPSFVIPLGRPTPPPSSSTGSLAVHGNGSPCSESDDEEMSYSSQRGKENTTSTRSNIITKLPVKTSCLFCAGLVIIKDEKNEFDEDADNILQESNERSKMVRNLCYHLNLNPKEIPRYCSEQMFPFCTTCLSLVRRLWESEILVQEVRTNISKLVTDVERTVADAEIILRPRQPGSSQMIPENTVMFTKLRDMIFEGYRNKLLMKKKLRETLASGEVVDQEGLDFNQTVMMKDEDIQDEYVKKKRQRSERSEAPSWTTSGTDENARNQTTSTRNCNLMRATATTARREPLASNRNPRPSKPAQPELDPKVVCKVEEIPYEDSWVENEGELVGLFYEGNSTLPTDDAPDVGTGNENPAVPMPMLKKEIDVPSEHNQIRVPDKPPVRMPKGARKCRSYNGIRFYEISRTETNSEFLECGACSFSLNSTKYRAEKKLPMWTIREHILNCHSKGVARPSTSSIQNGHREVKKNNNKYPSVKLWQRSDVGLPVGQVSKKKRQPKKKKRNIDISKMFGTFHCPFAPACPRIFSRKCHLALHLKSHTRKGHTLTEERATTTVKAAPPPPQPVVSSPILPTPPPPERLIPLDEIKKEPEPGTSGVRIFRKGSEITVEELSNTYTTSELCQTVGVNQV